MRYDDPNVPVSAVLGIIGAIALFVIIVLVQALFYRMEDQELARKVYSQPYEALQTLDADQREQLGTYRYVNEREGVVRIPIQRAMELLASEAGGR